MVPSLLSETAQGVASMPGAEPFLVGFAAFFGSMGRLPAIGVLGNEVALPILGR